MSRSIRWRENLTDVGRVRAEMLGGQRFVWSERTPMLRAMIDAAEAAVRAELGRLGRDAIVLRESDVLLGAHSAVIADIAVFLGATYDVPDLVIEYRAESTDRLFFGPKRLAYGRARVPDVWFADPANGTVSALRLGSGLDYPWPPATYVGSEAVRASNIGGFALPARAFFHNRSAADDDR